MMIDRRLGVLACLILLACSPTPERAAKDPGAYVYVTNESDGTISVIDPDDARVVATIAVGKRPRGIRISPDGSRLYVALSGSPAAGPGVDESSLPPADKAADGIGVIDLSTRRLLAIHRGVSDPEQLAVTPDGSTLFIASEDTGQAFIVDAHLGVQRAALEVGEEPEGVAVTPDGRYALVTSESDSSVAIIDIAARHHVGRVRVGERPRDIAVTSDSAFAYVSGENDASITEIDLRNRRATARAIVDGANVRPMGVVVSPNGRWLYIALGRAGQVARFERVGLRYIDRVAVGERPWGLAISADGTRLYAANGPSNDVSVIDANYMTVVSTVKVGERPWGVAVAQPRERALMIPVGGRP